MKIGVIGAGNVGGTVGKAWAREGHEVCFGLRAPGGEKARALLDAPGAVSVGTVGEAAAFGEAILLATPWPASEQALRDAGDLSGKLLLDCTNPLTPDFSGLEVGHTTSGAELVAGWAPGARVFKTLNQIGFGGMADPVFEGRRAVMFVAGPEEGKDVVLGLVSQLGFDATDAGDLSAARLLEPFAMLWIHLALVRGLGRDIGFALLRR